MEWIKSTERECSLFSYLCNVYGYQKNYKKYIGRNWKYFLLLHKNGLNKSYREKREYQEILDLVKSIGVDKLSKILFDLEENYKKMAQYLEIDDLSKHTDIGLYNFFKRFVSDYQEHFTLFLLPKYFGLVYGESDLSKKKKKDLSRLRGMSYFEDVDNKFLPKLFKEIGKRKTADSHLLYQASPEELLVLLKSGRNKNKIWNERKKFSAVLLNKGKINIFTGRRAEKISNKCEVENLLTKDTIVSGRVAFSGVVKGKVVVAYKKKDLDKKHDIILVTPMTTIGFVPYLKNVKAIVTDEGGIACHASIISRELKIPCIIGTKIATKVFKDGDLVEVDAEKGIVKKL
ncbi:MAG: PEP-utilizing enzyme [Candidatus Magasanikiibacteriota bacterium]